MFVRAEKIDTLFLYICKKVMPLSEHLLYIAEAVIDYTVRGIDFACCIDILFDGIVDFGVFGCLFGFGSDEYIEIGYIFIVDMAVGVCIFDPLAASIRAEKDNHVCGLELAVAIVGGVFSGLSV